MQGCKPAQTPEDPNQRLTKTKSPSSEEEKLELSKIPYREAVGSLIHIAQGTRPDISHAVNMVSRFSNNPGKSH